MANTLNDFTVGQRIEMHPATDLWMRGARYGDVVAVGKAKVTVQLDRLTRAVRVPPCLLLIVEG